MSAGEKRASRGPLEGVRVLEIGHYIAAPHCTMMLADQGAEVIKIEPPGGEPARKAAPFSPEGDSLYYACHNRGKRSVCLDLQSPAARPALNALLRWADIVVTNYSLAVPAKLGFDIEHLARVNERAILLHITGFGSWTEQKDHVAFDGAIQAMSGFAELTGTPDGPPLMSQVMIADHTAGAHAAYAAMCALWERQRTGVGRLVEISMLDVMTSYLSHHIPSRGVLGLSPTRQGTRSTTRFVDMFLTRDAPVYLAPITPRMWGHFAGLLGHPEWAPDPKQAPNLLTDPALKAEVMAAATVWFAERTSAEAVGLLQSGGVACGVVRDVARVYDEAVAAGARSVSFVDLAGGGAPAPVPGAAFTFLDEPAGRGRVPGVGEHTDEVLAELGLGKAQRAAVTENPSGLAAA